MKSCEGINGYKVNNMNTKNNQDYYIIAILLTLMT